MTMIFNYLIEFFWENEYNIWIAIGFEPIVT